MRPEARAGRERRDEREEREHAARGSLALDAAHALEAVDPVRLLAVLDTPVRARDEGPVERDGGLELAALEPAPSSTAYRGAAATSVLRAIGPQRGAALVLSLVERARGRADEATVLQALEVRLRDEHTLLEALASRASAHAPHLVSLVSRVAPTLRFSSTALRALARADGAEIERAIPRLALGLPPLDGKTRRALSRLVHELAPLESPLAAEALAALVGANVPFDRRLERQRPIERAAAAGALENLRVLESAGARLGEASKATPRAKESTTRERDLVRAPRPASAKRGRRAEGPELARLREKLRADRRLARFAVLGVLTLVCAYLFWAEPILGGVVTGVSWLTLAVLGRRGRAMRFLRGEDS